MSLSSSLPAAGIDAARHPAARRSTLVSVWVNVVLASVQVLVGVLARSSALVADGVHSLSDLLSDFIVLYAGKHSAKGPDADHQYGHQRFENAASLALGLLLLVVGLGMLYSAAMKFSAPQNIPAVNPWALYVALATLLCKECLFRYMLSVGKQLRSSMLIANAWHARSDAASSLVVALGIIGNLAGYPVLDPVAALVVGLMITRMGLQFGWRALSDLMDHAADEEEVASIRDTLLSCEGVAGLHDLRTRKMGDQILVDVHLEVDGELNVLAAHEIAERARHSVVAAHPVLDVMTHIDPVGQHLEPQG